MVAAAATMAELWTSFAKIGVPKAEGKPAWPAYTGYSGQIYDIGNSGFAAMSQKGRIHDGARRAEFGQECARRARAVACSLEQYPANGLVRSRRDRILRRTGISREVSVAGAVDRNGAGPSRRVVAEDTPADISGVDQLRTRRVQL